MTGPWVEIDDVLTTIERNHAPEWDRYDPPLLPDTPVRRVASIDRRVPRIADEELLGTERMAYRTGAWLGEGE